MPARFVAHDVLEIGVDRLHVSGEAGCLHNALHPPLAAAKLFRNCGRGNAIGSELDDGCDERFVGPFCAKGTTQGKDEGKDESPHKSNFGESPRKQIKSSQTWVVVGSKSSQVKLEAAFTLTIPEFFE